MRLKFRLAVVLTIAFAAPSFAAESIKLEESTGDGRVFDVTARMELSGQLQTQIDPKKAQALKLSGTATLRFLDRRLGGGGRDAEAYRAFRQYQQAEAAIEVEKGTSSTRLRDARRLIVAEGRREGVARYSPDGPMTRAELNLLQMPGDILAILPLLPRSAVEVGEKWEPDTWVMQALTNVEAVRTSSLSCEVLSATSDTALVKFQGKIDGAISGAATTITITGKYRYDRKANHIAGYELEQKEKRSVGAIEPGMDVTAKITVVRAVAPSPGLLTEAAAEKIPLEAPASQLLIDYETPWGVKLTHDRDWHLFHDTGDYAVLRLIEKGVFLAQCRIARIPASSPGTHLPEETFQSDVQKAHGEQFKSFANAELLKTDDGRFLYRVTVLGEGKSTTNEGAKPLAMQWLHYLCAGPQGDQCSVAFDVEASLVEKLANRDLAMIKSLQFLKRQPTAAP